LVHNSGGLGTPAHLRVEPGLIHRSSGGVLFLDEIATLSMKSQQELLTAMQEKKYSITGQSEMSSGAMTRTEPVPCFPKGVTIETEKGSVPIDQFVNELFDQANKVGTPKNESGVDILDLNIPITVLVHQDGDVFSDKLERVYRKPFSGKLVKLTLDDGTVLLATPDHPIKALRGFVHAKDLVVGQDIEAMHALITQDMIIHTYSKDNQRVANAYLQWMENPATTNKELGIDEKTIREWKKGSIPRAVQCVNWLKSKQLLPLYPADSRLPLIARLSGALFGDGGLVRTGLHFTTDYNSRADLVAFQQDLLFVFGGELEKHCSIREVSSENGHGLSLEFHSAFISRFFHALGVPLGDKVLRSFEIPALAYVSPLTQKEFFSALLSCEMTGKITSSQDKINFVMAKVIKFEDSHKKFLNTIRNYLQENQVTTSDVKLQRSYLKRIKSEYVETATYTFNIHTNYLNLANLQKALHVYYSTYKKDFLAKRFLASKEFGLTQEKLEESRINARALRTNGYTINQIQNKTGLSKNTIMKTVGPTYGRYSAEEKWKIKSIAGKFSSIKELAKHLGIPYTTVLFWKKRGFEDA
jgi:hypothetical protein